MKVYKFINDDYGMAAIESRRLKISRLDSLNDPFEWGAFSYRDNDQRRFFESKMIQMGEKNGIVCFAGNWSNILLWSHYADCHRGMCLGFTLDGLEAIKMVYSDNRPAFDALLSGDDDTKLSIVKTVISTKSRDWEYEQESRIYARLQEEYLEHDQYFCEFDDRIKLSEIILGLRSTTTSLQIVQALEGYPHDVGLDKAEMSLDKFEIIKRIDAF